MLWSLYSTLVAAMMEEEAGSTVPTKPRRTMLISREGLRAAATP